MREILNKLGYVLAIILAILLIRNCTREPTTSIEGDGKKVEVRLVTKIDTQYVAKNYYYHDTIKVPTLLKADTVFLDGGKQVAMMPQIRREYQDSVKVEDSIHVGYKAKVTGTLDNIALTYSNRKSIVVIHKTDSVFTTTTISKNAGGLFIGVDGGLNQVTPKLEYIKGKNAFSAGYNIINRSPQVGYSRKIF